MGPKWGDGSKPEKVKNNSLKMLCSTNASGLQAILGFQNPFPHTQNGPKFLK